MSWVSIDQETCNRCGICVLRCTRCFSKDNGQIVVEADSANCNLCGHCVALCPTNAILHHKMDMNGFTEYKKRVSFNTDAFIQFVRERRSHRLFRNKAIPREDLERLVETCRYTPTGGNVQTVELILVQDQDRIKLYSDLATDYLIAEAEPAKRVLETLEVEGKQNTEKYQRASSAIAYGERLALARKAGIDPILHRAPAVMIFHSVTATSTPKDNAVIASTTAALTARTMGLESCYIGLLERAANAYPPLFEALGLPADHRVYSVIVLGYPRLKFLRAVDRKPIKVRWE